MGVANIRSKGDNALFGGHNTLAMKYKLGIPTLKNSSVGRNLQTKKSQKKLKKKNKPL